MAGRVKRHGAQAKHPGGIAYQGAAKLREIVWRENRALIRGFHPTCDVEADAFPWDLGSAAQGVEMPFGNDDARAGSDDKRYWGGVIYLVVEFAFETEDHLQIPMPVRSCGHGRGGFEVRDRGKPSEGEVVGVEL